MRSPLRPRFRSLAFCLVLLGAGYVLGATLHSPAALHAQQDTPIDDYDDSLTLTINTLYGNLQELQKSLEAERKHSSAVDGPNAFALMVGGTDAVRDLEEDRGVDPETFAALYAGRAAPSVFPHLGTDDKGRVTYKGKVVRMYSRERLKRLYRRRDLLTNESTQ